MLLCDIYQYSSGWFCWERDTIQGGYYEHDAVSNHQHLDCLFNCLFRHKSKKTSKPCVTGLCEGNPPVNGGLLSQRASNAENVSIRWRHHVSSRIHKYNSDHIFGWRFRYAVRPKNCTHNLHIPVFCYGIVTVYCTHSRLFHQRWDSHYYDCPASSEAIPKNMGNWAPLILEAVTKLPPFCKRHFQTHVVL